MGAIGLFLQQHGLPMGTSCAPKVTTLVSYWLIEIESTQLVLKNHVLFSCKLIDDGFLIVKGSKKEVEDLVKKLDGRTSIFNSTAGFICPSRYTNCSIQYTLAVIDHLARQCFLCLKRITVFATLIERLEQWINCQKKYQSG